MSEIQNDDPNIDRCPHDEENPYLQVSRALIRDASVSPECRWLICYLLANTEKWTIRFSQVLDHVKAHMGRDRLYALFNEACEAGYMKKERKFKACKYFISERAKFKKCLQFPENQETGGQDTENQDTLRKNNSLSLSPSISKKNNIKEIVGVPPQPSAEASDLFDFFLSGIKKLNPKFKEPNKKKWLEDCDKLLRIDKRDLMEVKMVMTWLRQDSFWKATCLSIDSLRRNFDKLLIQMNANEEKVRMDENRKYALYWKNKRPDVMKGLTFNARYAMNLSRGKEIGFNLPIETFRTAFCEMFGGKYEPNRPDGSERQDSEMEQSEL